MNRRRRLVVALGGSVLAARTGAFAQQPGKVWRVGFLASQTRPPSLDAHIFGGFPRGMRELGYIEGKNLSIEWRFAEGKPERLDELAAELVRAKVDAIVVSAGAAALAAQKATSVIPVIFAAVSDPISLGLIKSLARPGGNITGRTNITGELGPKRFEFLLKMVPKVSRMAILTTPGSTQDHAASVEAAGKQRGVAILPVHAKSPGEIDAAFSTAVRENAGGLIVSLTPFTFQHRDLIADLAIKHRLPCIAGDRMLVDAGCLMSYGTSLADEFRRLATFVDKIFKGRKPADLPVEQPVTFELVINGKTAKALGLKIPAELLLQADKIVE